MNDAIDVRERKLISPMSFYIPKVYHGDIEGVLISKGEIKSRAEQIASEISIKYYPHDVLALCVLDGALKWYDEIIYNEHMRAPCEIATIKARSYDGTRSTGKVEFEGYNLKKIKGKRLLVVEDIIDTGTTLTELLNQVNDNHPESVDIVCMLDKPNRRKDGVNVAPDYLGFIIPDYFIVGFGMDYHNNYRTLPHLCVLKKEVYTK